MYQWLHSSKQAHKFAAGPHPKPLECRNTAPQTSARPYACVHAENSAYWIQQDSIVRSPPQSLGQTSWSIVLHCMMLSAHSIPMQPQTSGVCADVCFSSNTSIRDARLLRFLQAQAVTSSNPMSPGAPGLIAASCKLFAAGYPQLVNSVGHLHCMLPALKAPGAPRWAP